jgi:hypothetical protein
VVHFRYGPSVHLPQLSSPPHGSTVEVVFRREQPNSTDGTFTHVSVIFTGATVGYFVEDGSSCSDSAELLDRIAPLFTRVKQATIK